MGSFSSLTVIVELGGGREECLCRSSKVMGGCVKQELFFFRTNALSVLTVDLGRGTEEARWFVKLRG